LLGEEWAADIPPLQESSKRIDLIFSHAWSAGHDVILSMLYGRMNADSGNLCVGMVAE